MAATPWTADEDQHLRDLAAAGRSVRDMEAELTAAGTPRSRSSCSRRLQKLGVHVDRTQTAAATEAVRIDAKAKRVALANALLDDAERLRQQLWQPVTVHNFGGKDNTYNEHTLPQPPHVDQLKIVQAVGVALDRSLKLDLHDADGGHTEALALVGAIAAAINAAADQVETEQAAR